MRAEKSEMYRKLKNKRGTKEYEWWFLRYILDEIKKKKEEREIKQKRKRRRKQKQKETLK